MVRTTTKGTKTATRASKAKKSGAWAAIKRHPYRASLGVAAAVGVGAILLPKGKRKRPAAAKTPSRNGKAATKA